MRNRSDRNWITALAAAKTKNEVGHALDMIPDSTKIEADMLETENSQLVRVNFRQIFDVINRHRNRSDTYTKQNPVFENKCLAVLNGLLSHWIRENNPSVKNRDVEALMLERHMLTRTHEKFVLSKQLEKAIIQLPDLIRVNIYAIPRHALQAHCRDLIDDTTQSHLRSKLASLDRLFINVAEMRHHLPHPTTDHALRQHNALTGVLEALVDLKTADELGIRVSALRKGLENNVRDYVNVRQQHHDQSFKTFQLRVLSTDNHAIMHLCREYQNHLRRVISNNPGKALQHQPKITALSDMIETLALNGDASLRHSQFRTKFREAQEMLGTNLDHAGKLFLKKIKRLAPTQMIGTFYAPQTQSTAKPADKLRFNGRLFDRSASLDDGLQQGGNKARRFGNRRFGIK